jgi:hypothetical protein
MQTRTIFIRDGFWNSCYEPYDLPGAYCRTRYAITPTDGSSLPSNGEYKGFVPVDNLLRLVSGGEYFGGSMINQLCRDFTIVFDEAFHDEYRAGIERGYKGKRGDQAERESLVVEAIRESGQSMVKHGESS